MNSLPLPSPSLQRMHAAPVQLDDAAHQRQAHAQSAERAAGHSGSICMNRSNTDRCASRSMPLPLSRTRSFDVRRRRARADSQMSPPSGVYFAALLSMFTTTWVRRIGSPSHAIGSSPMSTVQRVRRAHR